MFVRWGVPSLESNFPSAQPNAAAPLAMRVNARQGAKRSCRSHVPNAATARHTEAKRNTLACSIGGDGFLLRESLGSFPTPGRSFPTEHQQDKDNSGCSHGV